jgi:2-keto-4-pentenoate hydratase/2-oxohepta-3-ene-1,7-dioic acid hydratase in catechol pathway
VPSVLVVEADGRYLDAGATDPVALCMRPELDAAWPEVEPPTDVLVPLDPAAVGKILCLGKNFRAHAEEFGEEVPKEPLFFGKLPETLVPHRAEVRVPSWYERRVDHEAELALVIGRPGKEIRPEAAFEHVAAYTVADDLTARSLQGDDRRLGHPWLRAKNLDGFCPLGPCLVPRDHLDLGDLRVTARVRARGSTTWETRQDASTRDWIVGVPQALAWLSKHLTLRTGDLVLMGTPAGVGPLEDGDEVVCAVEGIGELATTLARR